MTSSKGHQGAHVVKQQLNNKALQIQGSTKVDQEIIAAVKELSSELDEIIEKSLILS